MVEPTLTVLEMCSPPSLIEGKKENTHRKRRKKYLGNG
jgi:hypothetical protein